MRKNLKFLVKIVNCILVVLIMFSFSNIVYGAGEGAFVDLKNGFETDETPEQVKNMINTGTGTVIGVIRVIAVTIAIVMLLGIAMRYMLSSAGDRADIKKHAIAYVVGAVILFGVTWILGIIVNVANSIG